MLFAVTAWSMRGVSRAGAVLSLAMLGALPCLAAYPTAVNSQITDAVTQANVQVLGSSPAMAMGSLYQATAQALANAANNATLNRQQSTIAAQAATTMGVATIYSIDTASTGLATKTIFASGAAPGAPLAADSLGAEGILGGVSLLMFNVAGNHAPYADYYVVSDQGFDYYIDSDENLIMSAHQVRTFGDVASPAAEVGFLLPPSSVATYFPELLESSPSAAAALNSDGFQADVAPLRDIYFGVRYTDGTTTFYEASLSQVYSVPEASAVPFAGIAFAAAMVACRRLPKMGWTHN